MADEGYTGNGSEYRGNGVTRYVLERIDALDEKLDGKLETIHATAVELGADLRDVKKGVTEHLDGHEDWVASRKKIEKWVAGGIVTLLTVGSGIVATILSRG